MSDKRPIGIFDSGLGGLTVAGRIQEILPKEGIVYFGDTARVPYGTKSKKAVTRFSVENVEFLMTHDVKLVVAACNTASSLALDFLKRCFKVPVIGVIEPGARRAVLSTRNNRIGVIGTHATVSSESYEKAIRKMSPKAAVFTRSCPLFVPLVEEGWLGGEVARRIADVYLGPIRAKRIDTLILGCTHYPIMRRVIARAVGSGVILVDSAKEVAKEARSVLGSLGLLNDNAAARTCRFFVSDEPRRFQKMAERFLKKRIKCRKAAVQ